MSHGAWDTDFCGYRLVFGVDAIDRLGELAGDLDLKRPLLVCDAGLRSHGHVDRALERLQEAGCAAASFDAFEQNPTTRHVELGVARAREHDADGLVALGGGSALDCAKGMNFLLSNGGRMEDYWGSGKAKSAMLPSIGIPTTAGTGSEAQSYALISQAETGVKMACGDPKARFRTVVLDPGLAATAPPSVAGVAGIDAISHAVESYVSTRRNPISQMFGREAWRRLGAAFPAILEGSDDRDVWASMLLGAHLAGAAIEHSMLGAAHACANPLTARYSVSHGVAVGLMLPHVIRFNASAAGALYDDLAPAGPGEGDAVLESRIVALRSAAGLPSSLADCGVPRDGVADLAAEAEKQWTAGFNPRPVTRKDLEGLYASAF